MPKLPVISGRELIRAFERAGYVLARTKGSHAALRHSQSGQTVIVPLHDELKAGTLRAILRQAGIDVERLRELL